jgi:hypothetical protein
MDAIVAEIFPVVKKQIEKNKESEFESRNLVDL